VIGQPHGQAALLPRKELLIPILWEAEWAPKLVWMIWIDDMQSLSSMGVTVLAGSLKERKE
jgi:hypothetical protein